MTRSLSLIICLFFLSVFSYSGVAQAPCNNWLYLPPGTNSSVQIGNLSVPGTQITVEGEFCRTTTYDPTYEGGDIVSKHNDPTTVNYLLRPNLACITTSNGYFQVTTSCQAALNVTYQVAMVYDGSTLTLYRNGSPVAQVAATGTLYQQDIPARIGLLYSQMQPESFEGYINEVRIWNVARTQAQIQQYMFTSLPNPTTQTGLLAYYNFSSLTNLQGNTVWNGTIVADATTGQTNPYCNNSNNSISATLTGSGLCGSPATLTFQSSETGPFTITYSDGSQTYTQANVQNGVPFAVQVQPTAPTTYTLISFEGATDCQPAIAPAGIATTISPGAVSPDFSFTQNTCSPLQIEFTTVAQPGMNYTWTIDGANYSSGTPGDPDLSYNFSAAGTYPVTLTATSPTCSGSTSKNISIGVQPAAIINTPDTGICAGKTVPLRTQPLLDFCWSPTTYLDNPSSAIPNATPPVTTRYYLTAKTTGANLIANGNFESGNTGFSSGYIYAATNTVEGQYFVGNDPVSWNAGMSPCTDHTTGSGQMMMINGAPTAGLGAWTSEPVTVIPNTNYAFSIWIQSISPGDPAVLQFSLNGNALGNPINASANTCDWQQFYTTWNSGSSTIATISLTDMNTLAAGNDFAIDDISFAPVTMQMDSVTINVETPGVMVSPGDTTVCPGMPVPLQASGSLSYSWSPAAGLSDPTVANPVAIFPVSAAGSTMTFTVTGTSARGCIADTTITITQYPNLVSIAPDTLICKDDAAQLYATGGITYSWSPATYLDNPASPAPIARTDSTTSFMLTAIDINRCVETDSVIVRVRAVPVFDAPPGVTICTGFGAPLKSANAAGYIYSWSPSTGLSDPSVPYPTADPATDIVYTLNISDSLCASYDSSFAVAVTVKPSPVITATAANNIDCSIHTTQLTATGGATYSWTPVDGLNDPFAPNPIASLDSTTTFIVKGTDTNGCYNFDTLTVKVTATGANTFLVPNAFTPNGDGHNDCFGITHWGDVQLEEMQIYDRWGQIVFDTRNPSDCWDGAYKGKAQPTGAYPYIIRAHTFCGEITRTGVVMLIR